MARWNASHIIFYSELIGFHFILVRSHTFHQFNNDPVASPHHWMILAPSIKVITITSKERRTKTVEAVAMGKRSLISLEGHADSRQDEWVMQFISLGTYWIWYLWICIQQCTITLWSHNAGEVGRASHSLRCDALHSLIQRSKHFLKLWIWIKDW